MKYFELVVTVSLQDDIPFQESYGFIGNLISRAMVNDDRLKKLHEEKRFKFYTFCSFYPVEPEKVYHKGRVYITNIRSLSVDLILALRKVLPQINYLAKVIATDIRMYEYRPITELITLTPVVATLSDRCWVKEDGLILLRERAHSNAVKKFRDFYGEFSEPKDNFIEYIRQTNRTPIKLPYKEASFLGNKLVIGVKSDETSQKLAFTVLGAGMLEKNSFGLGYCRAK
jgi:CRISPR-associated endoribonuclease Cas6